MDYDYYPYYRRARYYRRGGRAYGSDIYDYLNHLRGRGLRDEIKKKFRTARDVTLDYAHRGKVGLQHAMGEALTEGSEFIRDPQRYMYDKQQRFADIIEDEGRRLRSASGLRYYGRGLKPYWPKTTYYGIGLDPYDYVGYNWK